MSAICGVFMRDHNLLPPEWLTRMTNAAISPAPDGINTWSEQNVGLACLNFFITPESVGNPQPLAEKNNQLAVVADIRLDNRDELIAKVKSYHQQVKKSYSDTELLLLAYKKWGADCVEHLLGDFAFAIWDKAKQELLVARDSLGAKFLVYYIDNNTFVFSTNVASILALPFITPSINEDKMLRTLLMESNDYQATDFKNIYFCPPAHSLIASTKKFTTKRYWKLSCDQEIHYQSDDQYTDHFVEILNQAVKDRLRCTGPVGLSLSGGCDSSLLAAIAANQSSKINDSQKSLKTFSYIFDKFDECDERRFINPVISTLNLDATLIPGDTLWTFRDLSHQELPRDDFFRDCYSNLPLAVMRHAHESGCQVLLDGHYGDTLFGGCDYLVSDLILKKRFLYLGKILVTNAKHVSWKHHIVKFGLRQLVPQSLKLLYRRFQQRQPSFEYYQGATEQRRIQANNLLKDSSQVSDCYQLPSRRFRSGAFTDPGWTIPYDSVVSNHRYPVQRWSPYFDRRLVEFMFALPTEQLSRPGRNRWIQRNAIKRFLPIEVAERSEKTRYEALLVEGLKRKERKIVFDLANNSLVVKQGWVKNTWLQKVISDESPTYHECYSLSNILHLELWLRSVKDAMENDTWDRSFQYISR